MTWQIPLADLDYGEDEKQAVIEVLNNRWLTMGAVTEEFENKFADLTGATHAVALANATVALHLACLALGIGPGDEVIVPSLSFVATANAVLYTGAAVQFADIVSQDELNISPEKIKKLITPRTKAIIVMHYGGFPCRMTEINEIADRFGLSVIEDSAHSPGAVLDGKALGTWGDIGCFSFFSNKNLATGEGGMMITDRDEIAHKVRLLRSHGMTSVTWDRHRGHAYSYDVIDLGYNYRTDEIRSALGLVQLKKLLTNNSQRAAITHEYWKLLGNIGVDLPFYKYLGDPEITPAYHILPILLPPQVDRKRIMDYLRSVGVQTSIHYPPIHQFSYYRENFPLVELPITDNVAAREITLPLYPTMDTGQVRYVVDALEKAISQ